MALEYLARIFYGKEEALSNVRGYIKKFLSPINARYEEVCDLLWRSFRNGVHYVILTSRPLEDSTVGGWQEKIAQQPTCGGAPDGHGSHDLF